MRYYRYFFIIAINFWIVAGLAKVFGSNEFDFFADISLLVLFFAIAVFLIEVYLFTRNKK